MMFPAPAVIALVLANLTGFGGGLVGGGGGGGSSGPATDVQCASQCVSDAEISSVSGSKVVGQVLSAASLTNNPADCSVGQFAVAIDASGNLACAAVPYAQVTGTPAPYSLPAATASALGGVKSGSCAGNNKVTGFAADGTMQCGVDQTGSGSGPQRVTSTADATSAVTSADTPVPGLSVPVLAGTRYVISCRMLSSSAVNTTGAQVTVNGPAAPVSVTWTRRSCASATADRSFSANAFGTRDAATGTAGLTRCVDIVEILLVNGVNAGDVTFGVRSEVAASAATIHAGSTCAFETY